MFVPCHSYQRHGACDEDMFHATVSKREGQVTEHSRIIVINGLYMSFMSRMYINIQFIQQISLKLMQVLLALWEFPNFISKTSCCEPSGPPEGKDCTVEAAQGARRSGSQRRLQTVQLVCLGEVSAGPSSRFSEICSLDGWFCYVLFLLEMGWYQQEGKIAPLMIDGAHRPFCRS